MQVRGGKTCRSKVDWWTRPTLGWEPRPAELCHSAREPQREPQLAAALGFPAREGAGTARARASKERVRWGAHSGVFQKPPQANSRQGSSAVWLPVSSGPSEPVERFGNKALRGQVSSPGSVVPSQSQGSQPSGGRGTRSTSPTGWGSEAPSQDTGPRPPASEKGQGGRKKPWTWPETQRAAPQLGSDVLNLNRDTQVLYRRFTHNTNL